MITQSITACLDEVGAVYQLLQHEHCHTSDESAAARAAAGGGRVTGAKAILAKLTLRGAAPSRFAIFVLSGWRKLDTDALFRHWPDLKKFRFATADEMREQTGLAPGALPPFGPALFPKVDALYYDADLVEAGEPVGFNAGDHCQSIVVGIGDLVLAAAPDAVLSLSKAE
jgi:Ala-tRNA(Pro) deacylase